MEIVQNLDKPAACNACVLLYLGWLYGGGSLGGIGFFLNCLVHFCQHQVSDELPVLSLVFPHKRHGRTHHLHHTEDDYSRRKECKRC